MAGKKKKGGASDAAGPVRKPSPSRPRQERSSFQPSSQKKRGSKEIQPGQKLSLLQRPFDLVWIAWFFNYWFAVMFTDLHNFTASYLGVEVKDLEYRDLLYPPKFLTELYFKWARTVDPLLYENPIWWQCIEWMNLLFLMPFSVAVLLALPFGWNWIRKPALITQSWTAYSVVLCIGSSVFGPVRTYDPEVFFFIYIPYLVMPVCAIWRFWDEKPFNAPEKKKSAFRKFLDVFFASLAAVCFAAYLYYIVEWFRRYTPWLDPFIGDESQKYAVFREYAAKAFRGGN